MLFISMWWQWWSDAETGDQKLLIPLLTIITLTIFTAYLYNFKKSKNAAPPLPPGPRGLPVVGYLPFLGTCLHKKFTQLAGVYGPIYKLWLGNKLCIVVSSPSVAKEIYRDNDKIFANRDPPIAATIITYGGNDILWSTYGDEWKKLRRVFVRETQSKASLDACYPMRKEEVQKCIRNLHGKKLGKLIDFGELVFEIATNASINMLCGGVIEGENVINSLAELRKLTEEIMVLQGKPNVSDLLPVLAKLDLQGTERQMRRILSSCDQIFDCLIQKRLNIVADKEGKKDFLQMLLDFNKNEDGGTSITANQLKALLLDIVVGGTETTSTMLEWAMAEVMLNQQVINKIHQELDQIVGINNIIEDFHLPKLKFLDAVVKETFRLHPAVPLSIPRSSTQSCVVSGYTIPKGTTVFLNIHAIHRDPIFWDKPLEFRPERFLNENDKLDYLGNNFQFLPFGSGRRVCAGLPLAERMVLYIFASLLHSFQWKLPLGAELELSEKFGLTIKKMKPLSLVAEPRLG